MRPWERVVLVAVIVAVLAGFYWVGKRCVLARNLANEAKQPVVETVPAVDAPVSSQCSLAPRPWTGPVDEIVHGTMVELEDVEIAREVSGRHSVYLTITGRLKNVSQTDEVSSCLLGFDITLATSKRPQMAGVVLRHCVWVVDGSADHPTLRPGEIRNFHCHFQDEMADSLPGKYLASISEEKSRLTRRSD